MNGTNRLQLNYDYGTTTNNGNVQSQTITVPTVGSTPGFVATQAYTYDSLNRLKQATETIPNQTGWQQTFTYDRYGNRNFDTNYTTTLGSCSQAKCNPTVDTINNNNRFTTAQGYSYDLSGNLIGDTNSNNRTFVYDGENHQKSVSDSSGSLGTYSYDGDGKRVKKVVGTETTIFVYDASGKVVAEYATTLSTTPQISYLTNDKLGTPRINTNANGNVIARHDYLPFGEEINSTITTQRNVNLNYGNEGIRQKFTAYERDTETELDFAEARMYANNLGRFTSVDMGPFMPADPQNFNRYAYAQNNPTKFVDPTGNKIELTGPSAKDFIDYAERRSGLKLKYKVDNKGKYTITGSEKDKNFTGTANKEFAKVLKETAGASETASWNVGRDVANTLVDDTVGARNNSRAANIDMDDIDAIDKNTPELGDALTAHVLIEGLRFAQGSPSDVGDPYRYGFKDINAGAHINGLAVEADVMSAATGKNEGKIAEHRARDLYTKDIWNVIFTTVQYDVTVKGSATNPNSVIVDKVVKTTPTRKPQFPPGP